jgi:hypothetical protein|tara:strand:+ start:439 stop:645 length:207 start_codon:yes stop_codon:yes gene_type:complete
MSQAWSFKLKFMHPAKVRTIKTFVYSDTGEDIEQRFAPNMVSNIKRIKDPLADLTTDGWSKKKEFKYI